MDFLWFLIIGALAGFLAGFVTKGKGFGLVANLVIGIIGVGCGLKPLDFTKLDFGALQKSLPPLPSGLPPLPNIDLKVEKKAAPANSSGQ